MAETGAEGTTTAQENAQTRSGGMFTVKFEGLTTDPGNIPTAFVQELMQSLQPKERTITINQAKDDPPASHTSSPPSADPSSGPSTQQQPSQEKTPQKQETSRAESGTSKKPKIYSPAEIATDKCEETLRNLYRTTGSYIQLIPWIGDDMMHIRSIVTEPQFKTGKGENEFVLDSYEDIFLLLSRRYHLNPIAIVTGLAGSGKTTLFRKIAYDWACGSSEVLRRYKLVFRLLMCELEQSSSYVDAVFKQLLPDDTFVEKDPLDTFIQNNPMKVLILLDGFDQLKTTSLSESSFGPILQVLNRTKLRGCTVLVSTRPSHYHRLVSYELVQEPFTHVEFVGFNQENINEYVNNFYSHDLDIAKRFLGKIQSSDLFSEMAKSPILLLVMCLLWRDGGTLMETVSRVFHQGVSFFFRRRDITSEEELSQVLVEIGKLFLPGLLSSDQSLSLKPRELESGLWDAALEAGILTRCRPSEKPEAETRNSLDFVYNEFAVAAYLQTLIKADLGEFQKILKEILSNGSKKFEYLLRFCCSDNEACTHEILKALQAGCQEKLSLKSEVGQLALHCFCEGQTDGMPPQELIHSFITDQLTIEGLDIDSLDSFTYFLKCLALAKDKDNAPLAKVNQLVVTECNLTWCGQDFAHTIRAMKNLHSMVLTGCSLTGGHVASVARLLGDLRNLVELNLSHNNLGGTAKSWHTEMKCLKILRKLSLESCSLNGEDIQNFAQSFKYLRNLDELNLSHNNLEGTAALWCGDMKWLRTLRKLGLADCSLNEQDIQLVGESLRDFHRLVELDLTLNQPG